MSPEETHLPQFVPQAKATLSELQHQFNASIQTIDHLKTKLAKRAKVIETARVRVQKEVQPLVQEMVARRMALVYLLDETLHQEDLPRLEKEKLTAFVKDQASTLVHHYGAEELTSLLHRYQEPAPASAAEAQVKAETQHLLKNVLGLEVNLQDLSDLEAFQARLDQQMQEEQEKREAQRAHRQKAKAQQAQAAKAKAQLQNISKASRRLYTTLAKLLHPDREQDPHARIWKEEAMKKVTLAYHQDDFFELFRLQLEFMQEQEQVLTQVPEEQLTYYVHLLEEQIKEMEDEHSTYYMGPDAHLFHEFGGTPKQMETKFRSAKKGLREEIEQLDFALADFKDPVAVREFLKRL
ncbi:J domain-containing protein [Rufibacter glacialis]|uniref:J domain-containing protein n=1 Tax=Rufibacter glacialis TaxID=1259555 RepID=A0A5M8Q6M5_9BACT|nr:J domain-containing protein [Rufibacter glacialis]KAA6430758.1 J domain-containing protein [Rufibacter glacialis]GGK86501.1 molecular chaperone DnaJ [Rufibacter glacialis]